MFQELARRLGADQPVYGLQARGLHGRGTPLRSVEEMARHYVQEVCALAPQGPYFLAGYCFGAIVAFEMAQQLRSAGQHVGAVVVFNGPSPAYIRLWGSGQPPSIDPNAAAAPRAEDAIDRLATRAAHWTARVAKSLHWRVQNARTRFNRTLCAGCLRLGLRAPSALQGTFIRMIHDEAERRYQPRRSTRPRDRVPSAAGGSIVTRGFAGAKS